LFEKKNSANSANSATNEKVQIFVQYVLVQTVLYIYVLWGLLLDWIVVWVTVVGIVNNAMIKKVVLAIIIPKYLQYVRLRVKMYITSKSLYKLINVDVICHLKIMTNVKFIHFLLLPQLLLHIVVHIRNWLCQQEKCIFRTSELRKKLDKFLKSTSKKFANTTKWLTALCNAQFRFEFLGRELPYFCLL
jgi:hypothetical protein